MNEYRCTRITPVGNHYPRNSPAFNDPSARQGHYIYASNPKDAYDQLVKRFPEDMIQYCLPGIKRLPTETFTVAFNKDVSNWWGCQELIPRL